MALTTRGLGGLGLSAEHKALQEIAARWLDTHCPPSVVRASAEADPGLLPLFWPELSALDWLTLAPTELAVVLEEAGRTLLPGPLLPTALARHVMQRDIADHEAATVAIDAPLPATVATDGSLRICGVARPVLCAAAAAVIVVPAELPGGELIWTAVRRAAPGVTISPLRSLDPTRPVAEVRLDDVAVGERDVARGVSMRRVTDLAATLFAAECSGGAQWCVDTAAEYARTRVQFGRPIGAFQAVKHKCADMALAAEQARAVAWDAAQALTAPSDGDDLAVAAAAVVAPNAFVDCAKATIQVLGGIGYTWEHDAHRYLRRAIAVRALLDDHGWQRRTATSAMAGVRRSHDAVLPAEAEAHRSEVRAFLADIDGAADDVIRRALVDDGYLVPEWPRPWGRGASAVEQLVIDEEFRSAGVTRPDLLVGMWALPTLIAHGTAAQQDRWIRPTLLGDKTWCQLFSEPEAGSDLAALMTKAAPVDGGWRLTGQKVWTSLAHVADWGLALARTSLTDPPHAGITCFVVDMHSPGVDVRPLRELTGIASFNEVYLADVFVPDENVIGDVGDGWRVARTTLANERVTMGRGSSLGRGLEGLLRLVAERPDLADDDGVLDRLGEVVARAHALSALGHRVTLRALTDAEPGPEASVRKLLSAEHDQRVEELGLQLLGAEASTTEGAARAWTTGFLMTRCLTIAGGTSEIQRNVLAERLLLLPRDD